MRPWTEDVFTVETNQHPCALEGTVMLGMPKRPSQMARLLEPTLGSLGDQMLCTSDMRCTSALKRPSVRVWLGGFFRVCSCSSDWEDFSPCELQLRTGSNVDSLLKSCLSNHGKDMLLSPTKAKEGGVPSVDPRGAAW